MGRVGTISGNLEKYLPIWRIVNAGISLSDIKNEWSFDDIMCFNDYLAMQRDYKSAWSELSARRVRMQNKKGF